MQGDVIVKRILSDAKDKSNDLISVASKKAIDIKKDADEFVLLKNQETENLVAERASQISERYKVLGRIEGGKILLNKKQSILNELKKSALDRLINLEKPKMLSLIEKLLKENANAKETLSVCINGITVKDIEELKIVKTKNLKVKLNKNKDEVGLILSNDVFDKNLTFSQLIEDAFEKCQGEINKILFPDNL